MADEEDFRRLKSGAMDLSRCDLRTANLSDMDLRGRDLSFSHLEKAIARNADFRNANLDGAKLRQLDAQGADLRQVRIKPHLVHVNFSGANLSGADLSGTRMVRVNFTGADIRSTNFQNAHFGDDVIFDNAQFDDATNFDGAEGLRYLSRIPAFHNYDYERGRFKRKGNLSEHPKERESTEVRPNTAHKISATPSDIVNITNLIGAAPKNARLMAANLSLAIRQHITLLESNKPNDPDKLGNYENQIALLDDVSIGLGDIASLLLENDSETVPSERNSERMNRAARIIGDLSQKLEAWVKTNGNALINHTVNAGLIGTCSAFFAFCGAPSYAAFAVASALVGGRPLIDAASTLVKPFGPKG